MKAKLPDFFAEKSPAAYLSPDSRPQWLHDEIDLAFDEAVDSTAEYDPTRPSDYGSVGTQPEGLRILGKFYDLAHSVVKSSSIDKNNMLSIGPALGLQLLIWKKMGWNVFGVSACPMGQKQQFKDGLPHPFSRTPEPNYADSIRALLEKELPETPKIVIDQLVEIQTKHITFTNANYLFEHKQITSRKYQVITSFTTWMYFPDYLGTLVGIYNQLLDTDGYLIIDKLSHNIPSELYQILQAVGYSFYANSNFFVLKKTKPTLELPYHYNPSSADQYQSPYLPNSSQEYKNELKFASATEELTKLGLKLVEYNNEATIKLLKDMEPTSSAFNPNRLQAPKTKPKTVMAEWLEEHGYELFQI